MFSVTLPLEPTARPRQRHRIIWPTGKDPYVGTYTPETGGYASWARAALLLMQAARRGAPTLVGPTEVRVRFIFRRPKGETRATPRPRRWHTAKPDADNVLKAVLDVAKQANWLRDDAIVARMVVEKIAGVQGEPPSVSVQMRDLPPYAAMYPAP